MRSLIFSLLIGLATSFYVGSFHHGPIRRLNAMAKTSVVRMDIDYPQSTSTSSFPPPSPSRKLTLDEVQREAILTNERAVIVVAGPGSGKTRVMSARLAYLLESGLCRPTEILVISFTKSTANNMRQQADTLLKESESVATTRGVSCHTFHTFCIDVLRQHMFPDLHIVNDEDMTRVVLSLLESKGLSPSYAMASGIQRQIRYWKELGLGYMGVRKDSLATEVERRAYELYPEYQNRLKDSTMDLGDVLLNTLKLFRGRPEVLESFREQYRHVLVDEFQDISPAQYDILRMLVVGQNGAFSATGGSMGMSNNPGDGDILNPVVLQLPEEHSTGGGGGDGGWLARANRLRSSSQQLRPDMPGFSSADRRVIEFSFNNRGGRVSSSSSSGNNNNNNKINIRRGSSNAWTGYNQNSMGGAKRGGARNRVVNVFCAGDDDQSIYAWRGAQVELMRRFRFDFPGAAVLRFDVSYRLSESLCKAASSMVQKLPGRIDKNICSHEDTSGRRGVLGDIFTQKQQALRQQQQRKEEEQQQQQQQQQQVKDKEEMSFDNVEDALAEAPAAIRVTKMADEGQELEHIVKEIRSSLMRSSSNSGAAPRTMVVLTKTQAELNKVKEALTSRRVPYRSRGYGAWVLPAEGGSLLNLLRLIASPHDDQAFEAALDNDVILTAHAQLSKDNYNRYAVQGSAATGTVDAADVRDVILPAIWRHYRDYDCDSMLDAAREAVLSGKLEGKYHFVLSNFLRKFDSWRADVDRGYGQGRASVKKALYTVLRSAYGDRWNRNLARAVDELSRGASSFDSLGRFVSAVRLEGDFVVEDTSGAFVGAGAGNGGGAKRDAGNNNRYQSPPQQQQQQQQQQAAATAAGAGTSLWVMTMHSAKGLEFDEVFLPFWTEGNVGDDDRRLAFVSLTRARDKVMISYSNNKAPAATNTAGAGGRRFATSQQVHVAPQQPSVLCTELLNYDKQNRKLGKAGVAVFEDLSVGQQLGRRNTAARVHESARRAEYLAEVQERAIRGGGGSGTGGKKQQVAAATAAAQASSSPAAAGKKATKTATKVKKSAATSASTRGQGRKPKAAVVLPAASKLSPTVISDLLYYSGASRPSLMALFKDGLAAQGLRRGQVPVMYISSEGEVAVATNEEKKMISKCNADELGAYLAHLLASKKKR
jgi:superfamily I DNA/RNA helicase